MHYPPPNGVWSLTDTVSGAFGISRGMVEAATSDNISPLALMSCENFGSTIPTCIETRVKIEQLARRSHSSHVFKFVKTQVGWRNGDSVELLSRSDGGIRFLCLAAALCTLSKYEAAVRLDGLLQETQKDAQLRPTISQLHSMMVILESKLALSSFANNVAGWEIWFRSQLAHIQDPRYRIEFTAIPPKKAFQDMVLFISEHSRLGQKSYLSLKMGSQIVPWCIAFIKWLFGLPPLVRLVTGKILLDQEDASILIEILPQPPAATSGKWTDGGYGSSHQFEVTTSCRIKTDQRRVFGYEGSKRDFALQGARNTFDWTKHRIKGYSGILQDNATIKSAVGQVLVFIVVYLPCWLLVENNTFVEVPGQVSQVGHERRFSTSRHFSAFPWTHPRNKLPETILGTALHLIQLYSSLFIILDRSELLESAQRLVLNIETRLALDRQQASVMLVESVLLKCSIFTVRMAIALLSSSYFPICATLIISFCS